LLFNYVQVDYTQNIRDEYALMMQQFAGPSSSEADTSAEKEAGDSKPSSHSSSPSNHSSGSDDDDSSEDEGPKATKVEEDYSSDSSSGSGSGEQTDRMLEDFAKHVL
jgi:hypothetical protein